MAAVPALTALAKGLREVSVVRMSVDRACCGYGGTRPDDMSTLLGHI